MNALRKHYSWIGADCPPEWVHVGWIDLADPADVATALDRGRRIGSTYDGGSGSVAEPCTADTYMRRDEMPDQATRNRVE
jgi:hypothetical protein